MTPTIPCLHPVPMRFVPRGGRVERAGYAATVTPVVLREADPAAFRHVGTIARAVEKTFNRDRMVVDRPLHEADGSLWIALMREGRAVTVGQFGRFLSGEAYVDRHEELSLHFHATPLLAGLGGYATTRGDAAPGRARQTVDDGTARARADLVRFLDDDVAIVDGGVMVRLRNATATLDMSPHDDDREGGHRIGLAVFPRRTYVPGAAGPPGDPAAVLARLARLRIGPYDKRPVALPGDEGLEAYYGIACDGPFPYDLARDGDLSLYVQEAHGLVLKLSVVVEAIADAAKGDGIPPEMAAALSRSREWSGLGSVGSIRPEEYGQCVVDLRTTVSEIQAAFRRPANSFTLRRMSYVTEELVAPRLGLPPLEGPPPVAPEDEEALGGLGMGM